MSTSFFVYLLLLARGILCSRRFHLSSFEASSFAGETVSAVFPVPNATNAAQELDSFFPDASAIGFAGPTPTGDEAELVATATAVPKVEDALPLLNPSTFDNKSSFNVLHSMGNLSPMFSIDSLGLLGASEIVPEGCELTQVHLLYRHAARYPTLGSLPAEFASKLHSATTSGTGFTATRDLAFLNTWTYKLGAEILTPFGRQQAFDLGVSFRVKYGELLKKFTGLPVFRTTSQERMLQSGINFAAGFFGVPDYQTNFRQVITIENSVTGNNNTLAPNCPNRNNLGISGAGSSMSSQWRDVYLQDALARLAPQIRGINLTTSDVLSMQQLCAYETNALGSSAFCDLFTEEEWKGFEYFIDLGFWYANGPGSPTAAAFGIGYVQELVARLTQTLIAVHYTSTNATITDSNVTFPLDQPIYADATHDNTIASIAVAMNFTSFAANGPLPADHIPENQTYFVNQIAPFASRLVGQVLSCASSSPPSYQSRNPSQKHSRPQSRSRSQSQGNPEPKSKHNSKPEPSPSPTRQKKIRWILNDAILPLGGISGCPQVGDNNDNDDNDDKNDNNDDKDDKDGENGLCPLETFISAMKKRLAEVDFAFDCFGNYTIAPEDLGMITDGRPPVDLRP